MGNCNCLQMQKSQALSNKINDFLIEEENQSNIINTDLPKKHNLNNNDQEDNFASNKINNFDDNKTNANTNLISGSNFICSKGKENRNSSRGVSNPMQNNFKFKGRKDSEKSGKDVSDKGKSVGIYLGDVKETSEKIFPNSNVYETEPNVNNKNNSWKEKDAIECSKFKVTSNNKEESNVTEAYEKQNASSNIYANTTHANSNSNNGLNNTTLKYSLNKNSSTNNNIQFDFGGSSNPPNHFDEATNNNKNNHFIANDSTNNDSNNLGTLIDANNKNFTNNNNSKVTLSKNLTQILAMKQTKKEPKKLKNNINIVFLGDKCVGKTSLVYQYTSNKFDQYYIQTIAREEFSKNVNFEGKNYLLNLIVTSGVPQYQEDYSQLYSEADFLCVCFDLTQVKSFEKAKDIIKNEVKACAFLMNDSFANIVLIGNKADLARERKVKDAEINEFSNKYKIQFFETSAKTKLNVQLLFKKIIEVYDQVIT